MRNSVEKNEEESEAQLAPPSPTSSLRRNFVWTLAGNLVYTGSQFLTLMLFAKLTSPEQVGRFTLGFAITAPIILLTNLQLRGALITDAEHRYVFGDYLGLRLVSLVVALVSILGAIVWGGYQGETAQVIGIVGVAKAFEAISDIFNGYHQQQERLDVMALSAIIRGVSSVIAVGVALWLTGDEVVAVLAMAFAWGSVLVGYDIHRARVLHNRGTGSGAGSLGPRFSGAVLWRLARLTLPLGLVMMMISLNTNIPRYVIEDHLGEAQLGIFAALAYLLLAGTTLVSALAAPTTPRLARYLARGDVAAFRALRRRLSLCGLGIGIVCVGVAMVGGRVLLTLLYTPQYAEYTTTFTILMLAGACGYISSFTGCAVTASRTFGRQLVPIGVSLGVTVLLAHLLVPRYGLNGAAVAVLASSLSNWLLMEVVLMRALRRAVVK